MLRDIVISDLGDSSHMNSIMMHVTDVTVPYAVPRRSTFSCLIRRLTTNAINPNRAAIIVTEDDGNEGMVTVLSANHTPMVKIVDPRIIFRCHFDPNAPVIVLGIPCIDNVD